MNSKPSNKRLWKLQGWYFYIDRTVYIENCLHNYTSLMNVTNPKNP